MRQSIGKLIIAAVLLAGVAWVQAGTMKAKGSNTRVILAQKCAQVHIGNHAEAKIQVSSGGSGTGFTTLQNKATDLANASHEIRLA